MVSEKGNSELGFCSEKGPFEKLGTHLDKGFYQLLQVVGTILLTLGGAFASNYDCANAYVSKGLFTFLLTNPYLGLASGAIALFGGGIGSFQDYQKLANENKTLKQDNSRVDQLKSELDGAQEESQQLKAELKTKRLYPQGTKPFQKNKFYVDPTSKRGRAWSAALPGRRGPPKF